jgi:hypothetical protein
MTEERLRAKEEEEGKKKKEDGPLALLMQAYDLLFR